VRIAKFIGASLKLPRGIAEGLRLMHGRYELSAPAMIPSSVSIFPAFVTIDAIRSDRTRAKRLRKPMRPE
jgi:hypothetical protein